MTNRSYEAEGSTADGNTPVHTSRRTLLHIAMAGLIARITAPLFAGSSAAFAAPQRNSKILIAYDSRTGTTRDMANLSSQR